jgi:hypothetical protein
MTDRPTALQATIDDMIAKLVSLRSEPVVCKCDFLDEEPDDLRDLSKLTKDAARICDPFFHEIAYQGGLSSRSGASPHANIVTDAIMGNLEFELRELADQRETERCDNAAAEARAHGKEPKTFDPSREHSTLNGCQQGIRTTFARARG